MRVAFSVYGALYVVIEIVGYQLEQVSWPEITPLDVATAVANALLTIAVLVAALVAIDVLGHHWRRHLHAVRLERARLATADWADPEPIGVHSWRAEPLALPSAPVAEPPTERPYAENAYARQAWPHDAADTSGRLL